MKQLKDYGLHHVGFVVKNLEQTVARLEELYGLKALEPYEFMPNMALSYGRVVSGYKLKIAMIFPEQGAAIEVIQPMSGDGVHKDFVDAGNSGIHHICLAVDDYDHWHNHFEQSEAEFVFESETEDEINGYRRCFYVTDPGIGSVVEMKENPYFRK